MQIMNSLSNSPVKANHKIVYSTKNNTFVRNKKLFGQHEYGESASLELNHQITEKVFKNNQAIAQKLLETKLQRTFSLGISETPKNDQLRSSLLDSKNNSDILDDSGKALARTLSLPKNMNIGVISNDQSPKLKKNTRNSNLSSLYEPSSDLLLPKLEESSIESASIVKEAKALKRFVNDRKKYRGFLKHKSDISYLSNIKREGNSHHESQILELQLATQNQLTAPILENELDSRRSQDEPKIKYLRSANVSPSDPRDRISAAGGLRSLANVDFHKRQLNRFPMENTLLNTSKLQFVQGDSHRSIDPKSIYLSSASMTPLTSKTSFFSKAIYSENKYHEGAVLNLENLQPVGYLEGFTENRFGTGFSVKNSSAHIPKISEKAEGKPVEFLKAKSEESVENQALFQDLRKEIPSITAGTPPSRNDTILLSHWLENKLKVAIESPNMTEKQKCLSCDEIYNIGLNEIVRQIKFECSERAELLLRIWMSYLRLFNQFKLSLMADQAKIHDEYEEAYNRVHKMYKDIISESNEQREKLQKQLQQLTSEKNLLQTHYERLTKDEAVFLQKNRELRVLIKKITKQMKKLKEDNDALNLRLTTRAVFQPGKSEGESPKKTIGFVRTASSIGAEERKLSTGGFGQTKLFSFNQSQKKPEIQEDKDSSISDASSDNLAYEMDGDASPEARENQNIHKIEQLNSLALVHMVPDVIKYYDDREIQTGTDLYDLNYRSSECQTDLKLVNANYDDLLSQQDHLDELVMEHKLKKEVDVIDSAGRFDFMGHSPQGSIGNQDSLRTSSVTSDINNNNDTSRLKPLKLRTQPVYSSSSDLDGDSGARSAESIAKKKAQLISQKGKQRNINANNIFTVKSDLTKTVKKKGIKNKSPIDPTAKLDSSEEISSINLIRMKSENLHKVVKEFRNDEDSTRVGLVSSFDRKMEFFNEFNPEGLSSNNKEDQAIIQKKETMLEVSQDHRSEGDDDVNNDRENDLNLEQNLPMEEDHKIIGGVSNLKKPSITEVSEKDDDDKSENQSPRLKPIESETENYTDKTVLGESLEMSHLINESNLRGGIYTERGSQQEEEEHLKINLDELDPSEIYSSEEDKSEDEEEELSQASFSIILEEEAEDVPQSIAVIQSTINGLVNTNGLSINKEYKSTEPVSPKEKEKHIDEIKDYKQENVDQQQVVEQTVTQQRLLAPPSQQNERRPSQLQSSKPRKSRVSIHYKSGSNTKINPLYSLATIKSKIDRFMQVHHIGNRGASTDELNDITVDGQDTILDKAKYLQVVRLYKVEAEKSKLLQHNLNEIKESFEKENKINSNLTEENQKLKDQLNELSKQIDGLKSALENSFPKCKHGRCQFCREEEEAAAREEEKVADEKEDESEQISEDANSPKKRKKKDGNKKTFAQTILFGRRNAIDRKDNPAPAIIAKLRSKKMSQFKNFMPLKLILKQINSIYEERLRLLRENTVIQDEELSCFAYNTFLNLFGFKKIAEQKLIVLVLSVKKNIHNLRINLFARFLGLIDGTGNYNVDEFNKYIECLDFLSNCNLGVSISTNEGDSKHYTPYVRFLEYLKYFAEGKIGMEEYIEFKKEFESVKEADPKGANRYGIIDVDLALMKVLTKYRIVSNRVKQFVIDAFQSIDIDGKKVCTLRKFKLLFKYIEPEKYDDELIQEAFEDYAQANKEGILVLSYDQFAALCVELNFFSEYKQDKYLMITKKEQIVERFNELSKNHFIIRDQMETDLRSIKSMEPAERDTWSQNIDYVCRKVLYSSLSEKEYKPLLISISILRDELQNLAKTESK